MVQCFRSLIRILFVLFLFGTTGCLDDKELTIDGLSSIAPTTTVPLVPTTTTTTPPPPVSEVDYVIGDAVLALSFLPGDKILVNNSWNSSLTRRKDYIAEITPTGGRSSLFDVGPLGGFSNFTTGIDRDSSGKYVAVGAFTHYQAVKRRGIARVLANGNIDSSFDPGTGFGGDVPYRVLAHSSGKIWAAGGFTTYNGTAATNLVAINSDGSVATDVNLGAGANSYIWAFKEDSSGRILAGGDFTSINSVSRNRIARILANGTIDTGFNPGTGFNNSVMKIVLQPDGKIICLGSFTSFNGTARNRIARLNADGTLDTLFNPGSGFNGTTTALILVADGKMVVGGDYTTFNGTGVPPVVRLNADGSIDNTFSFTTPWPTGSSAVTSLLLTSGNKILLGGGYNLQFPTELSYLIMLNLDGSLDNSFRHQGHVDMGPQSIFETAAGNFTMGGSMTSYGTYSGMGVAILNSERQAEPNFKPHLNDSVRSSVAQPDGKWILVGNFTNVGGVSRSKIARFNADNSLDTSFVVGSGFNSHTWAIALQPDGKILVGGQFSTYQGASHVRIARLNTDGSYDTAFRTAIGSGFNNTVHAIHVTADNKILVNGSFTTFNGVSRNRIARLNADGSLDTSFNPVSGANGDIRHASATAGSRYVIAGNFTMYDGVARNRIAVINEDGTLVPDLDPGVGFDNIVYNLLVQADGKIVVGGLFQNFQGSPASYLIRLNSDLTKDTGFQAGFGNGYGTSGYVYRVYEYQDRIWIVGGLQVYNGEATANGIAVLDQNGIVLPRYGIDTP